jgi:ABC-type proline/glycine betaine transport system permease subunit
MTQPNRPRTDNALAPVVQNFFAGLRKAQAQHLDKQRDMWMFDFKTETPIVPDQLP